MISILIKIMNVINSIFLDSFSDELVQDAALSTDLTHTLMDCLCGLPFVTVIEQIGSQACS